MIYDFDKIIERRGSGALKYDALTERYGRPDLLPLWVADMDFATPPFIMEAMRKRLDHPVMGYTVEPADYKPAIIRWYERLHGVKIRPEWISFIPGIVKGIGMVINCFSKPGDKVVIMPPVYHPFRIVPQENGREVVWNPLRPTPDGRYEIDFENLEAVSADGSVRILILCNPHNPAGIVWSEDELRRLAAFCAEREILVISDEIHSEMLLHGRRHLPFFDISADARRNAITFAAPSKTFNIAGVVSSYAIVPDERIRDKFYSYLKANEFDEPTIFSPIATIAAYGDEGFEWRRQMLEYVERNIEYIADYCDSRLPGIRAVKPEASFLVWLDCRGLGLDHEGLVSFFVNDCHLALNDGEMFGPGGEGFMRLNAAAPCSVIEEALDRIRTALQNRIGSPQSDPTRVVTGETYGEA